MTRFSWKTTVRFHYFLPLFSAILFVGSLSSLSVAAENAPPHVNWRTDYAQALNDSQTSHKPLLLFFTGSDWCSVCKKLENAVLHEAEVVSFIESEFIPVMLDYPRSFQLSEELTRQNDTLNKQFRIQGYPTVIACCDDEKPYGLLLGYSGNRDETVQNLKSMAVAGSVLASLPDDFSVETTTDQTALNTLVTNLSVEQLAGDWLPYMNRAVELTTQDDPSYVKINTIREQVADINDIKAWTAEIAKLSGGISRRGMRPPGPNGGRGEHNSKTPDMIQAIAFIDARMTESTDKPKKLEFLTTNKVTLLSAAQRWDDAIALMKQTANTSDSDDYAKARLKREIALLLIRKGDCDQAIQFLTDYHNELVAINRDGGLPLEIHLLQEFLFYGHPEITARYADKILAEHKDVPKNLSYVYYAGDQAYRILGINLESRAICLEKSVSQHTDSTMKELCKAEAAVCYRAMGSNQKADDLLKTMTTPEESVAFGDEAPRAGGPLQQQVNKTIEAAKGDRIMALRFLASQANEEGAKRLNLEADALELERLSD